MTDIEDQMCTCIAECGCRYYEVIYTDGKSRTFVTYCKYHLKLYGPMQTPLPEGLQLWGE